MKYHWILAIVIIALFGFLYLAPPDFSSGKVTGFAAAQGMLGSSATSAIAFAIIALIAFAVLMHHINRQRPL